MSGRPFGSRARVAVLAVAVALAGCGDRPERLLEQAQADWKAGRLDQAEAVLARLAESRPLTLPERLLRAQVARDRGRVDEAIAALGEESPGMTPAEAAVVASTRGTLELVRHRFRDAEAALTRALTLDPSRAEALRELANLYALQGRHADLAAQLRALAASPPGPGSLPLGFADLYLWALGRREDLGPADLADALALAVRADPADRPSRLALAENLRRLGRLDEALETLRPLPASDPEAQVGRARVALDRGDDAGAAALLDGVPGLAAARLRGRVALARGDAPEAVRAFREVHRDAPDDRDTLAGLGQALRLTGDPKAARPYAQAARDRDRLDWLIQNARPPSRRDDPAPLRAIGDACLALGRRDEARAWYRLALSRNPLDRDLQAALFRLDNNSSVKPTPTP